MTVKTVAIVRERERESYTLKNIKKVNINKNGNIIVSCVVLYDTG